MESGDEKTAVDGKDNTATEAMVEMLRKGDKFLKFGRKGNPHDRYVFLSGPRLFWGGVPNKKTQKKSMVVSMIQDIVKGKETDVFTRRTQYESVPANLCFSIIGADRTLDLRAASEEHRDEWADALKALVEDVQQPHVD